MESPKEGGEKMAIPAQFAPELPRIITDIVRLADPESQRNLLRYMLRSEFGDRVAQDEDLVEDLLSLAQEDGHAVHQRIVEMKQVVAEHDTLLEAKEVAKLFRVTPKAVYKWIQQGKIKAIRRPGDSYLIPVTQFADSLWRIRELENAFQDLRRKGQPSS